MHRHFPSAGRVFRKTPSMIHHFQFLSSENTTQLLYLLIKANDTKNTTTPSALPAPAPAPATATATAELFAVLLSPLFLFFCDPRFAILGVWVSGQSIAGVLM